MHVSRLRLHLSLVILAGTLASLIFLASPHAADRAFHLSVDPELANSKFIKFLLPRFSLKHATRIVLAPEDMEADANFNRAVKLAFGKPPGALFHQSVHADVSACERAIADGPFFHWFNVQKNGAPVALVTTLAHDGLV